ADRQRMRRVGDDADPPRAVAVELLGAGVRLGEREALDADAVADRDHRFLEAAVARELRRLIVARDEALLELELARDQRPRRLGELRALAVDGHGLAVARELQLE